MSPIAFTLGKFEVRWYSIFILVGVILGFAIIMSESKRFQLKNEVMFNTMFWGLLFGILGARVYYIIFNMDYYSSHFSEIFKIWHGGLAIHGGLLFGMIAIYVYIKKYNVSFKKILDIFAPAVILGQAIGRWGNFFNGEAYGTAVSYETLESLRIIPTFIMDNMYFNGSFHLPMFYFESILCLIGFVLLLIYRRRKYRKNGQTFGLYLMWYGFIRFFIEMFRTDSLMLGSIKVAQIVSIMMVLFGLYIILVQGRKPKLEDLYNRQD